MVTLVPSDAFWGLTDTVPFPLPGADRNGVSAGAGGTAVVIIVIVIRGHCAGDIVDLHRVIFSKAEGL